MSNGVYRRAERKRMDPLSLAGGCYRAKMSARRRRIICWVSICLGLVPISATRAHETPRLGVVVADLTVAYFLPNLGWPNGGGVYVVSVIAETPAALAGIRPKDAIAMLDEKMIGNVHEFVCVLAGRKPGDVTRFTVVRDGQAQLTTVILGRWPGGLTRVGYFQTGC